MTPDGKEIYYCVSVGRHFASLKGAMGQGDHPAPLALLDPKGFSLSAFSCSLNSPQAVRDCVADSPSHFHGITRFLQTRLWLIARVADVHAVRGEHGGVP